jgi:fermentation-respiration switch protein FrsA (DUF1100 family)
LTWQAAQIVPALPRATSAILRLLHVDPLESQRKAIERIRSTSAGAIRIHGTKVNARWLREFLDYDTVPVFERITVPILVLTGAHDMQVPPEDAAAIGRLVAGRCEARVIEGLSHVLRPDPESKGPRAYRKALRKPVTPTVLTAITAWIDEQDAQRLNGTG